ncbi:MAG: tetratricopeptide repeat protein [Nitrospinota bacterium]
MRFLIWKVPVIVLLVSFPLFGCATSGGVDSLVEKKELAQKKYREALQFGSLNQKSKMLKALNEAIELDPNDANFHFYLGQSYFVEGDFERAESEFLKSIHLNNGLRDAYEQLGQISMRKKEWKKAIANFNKTLSLPGTRNPLQIYNWLALSHYNLGENEQAEVEWKKALQIKENAAIRLNLGLAYIDKSKFELAKDSLEMAIQLQPRFAQAHFELAQLYIRENKKEKAKEHFKNTILYSPRSAFAMQSKEYLEKIDLRK